MPVTTRKRKERSPVLVNKFFQDSVNESEDSSTDGSEHSVTESKSEEDLKTEALEPIYNDENNF